MIDLEQALIDAHRISCQIGDAFILGDNTEIDFFNDYNNPSNKKIVRGCASYTKTFHQFLIADPTQYQMRLHVCHMEANLVCAAIDSPNLTPEQVNTIIDSSNIKKRLDMHMMELQKYQETPQNSSKNTARPR